MPIDGDIGISYYAPMGMTTKASLLRKIAPQMGGFAALARLLEVSPPTVHQWASGARPVPADRCPQIERVTHGKVTCEDLRPDVDWAYLRGTAKKRKAA